MLSPTGKGKVRFALGTLFAPVLLLEDGLRKCGMDVSPKGLNYNMEGKSISEIWAECARPTGNDARTKLAQALGGNQHSGALEFAGVDSEEDAIAYAKRHGIPL